MRDGITKLRTFPRGMLIEEPLCRARTRELSLYQSLGDPTGATAPMSADPTLFWDLECDCGLVMGLRFHQLTELVVMQFDQADVAHGLRHLEIEIFDVWLLRVADPGRFAQLCASLDVTWWIWRVRHDGIEEPLKRNLTERDARCWAAECSEVTGLRHWAAPGPSV